MTKKEKILKLTLELFLTKGYENSSMNVIAHNAGIKKPTLYHHFKDKAELDILVFNYWYEKMGEEGKENLNDRPLIEQIRYYGSALEKMKEGIGLRRIFGDQASTMGDKFKEFLHSLAIKYPEVLEKLHENSNNFMKRFVTQFENAMKNGEIRDDIDPKLLSYHLLTMIKGIGSIDSSIDEFNLQKQGPEMFESFIKMLRVKG